MLLKFKRPEGRIEWFLITIWTKAVLNLDTEEAEVEGYDIKGYFKGL